MSGLGSLLLQPQALARLNGLDDLQGLGDDIVALLQQILLSPDQIEALLPAFQRAFGAMATNLQQRMEPRLDDALAELQRLAEPLLNGLTGLAERADQLETVGEFLDLLMALLEQVIGLAEGLSQEALRSLAGSLSRVFSDTLGLNQSTLREEIRQLFGALRSALLEGSNAMSDQAAGTRIALAALIGRLERQILPLVPTIDMDPNRLAQQVMDALRRSGFETIRAQAQCILEKVRALLGAGTALVELAKPSVFNPDSVGAAAARPPLVGDKYCWYASWLYRTQRRGAAGKAADALLPGYPYDEVWISADGKQVILRRAMNPDEVLYENEAGNVQWTDAPMFRTASGAECYTFGVFPARFLEIWTLVAQAVADAAKVVCHIVDCALSPKEFGVNIPMMLWHSAKVLSDTIARAPFTSFLTAAARAGLGTQWAYVLVPLAMVTLGSLEGLHTKTTSDNAFLQWITLLGGDALSAYQYSSFPETVHDTILSLFTLINYRGPVNKPDGSVDTRPQNRNYFTPLVNLAVGGFNLLLIKYAVPRDQYAHHFHKDNTMFYAWWLAGGIGMGILGGIAGTLAGWACARSVNWTQFGEQIGWGALKGFLFFLLQWYTTKEGDTNDGKYNPGGTEFNGYPDAASSPYKLPYAKDTAMYVGQANMGMFSHMFYTNQVYAYDFAHDFGDNVLAARGGTVVDYFDWVPDNTEPSDVAPPDPDPTDAVVPLSPRDQNAADAIASGLLVAGQTGQDGQGPSWNFVLIRHDTRVDGHDQDAGGGDVITYAAYGHGQTGSVRAAFAARGIAANAIIGTVVNQGDIIMQAGDTGISFHNHLHMHVLAETGSTPATPPVKRDTLSDYTLPFVFSEKEASHVLAPNGVLQKLTWYKSDNG